MAFSCDCFVALPPATVGGCVIFGKNSDRPGDEVQEVIYRPSADYNNSDEKVQCTYVSIEQVKHTHAVVLSRPGWMWGAEMGANECGVVIGNEAIWTRFTDYLGHTKEGLLGMDYVRLGLERGSTARQAMAVITDLLKVHGQCGRCFENEDWSSVSYCNSFLIADRNEAWVLETAGRHWAAERITSGVRNISNLMSIGTQIDAMSDGLIEFAQNKGLWSPDEGSFHFTKAFSTSPPVELLKEKPEIGMPAYRLLSGKRLLETLSKDGNFDVSSMQSILKDEESGICCNGETVSVGSQVSVLWPPGSSALDVHWLTATPIPARSVFKPFVFVPGADVGRLTESPAYGDEDPVKTKPRFQRTVDRQHSLYKAHAKHRALESPDAKIISSLKGLQQSLIADCEKLSRSHGPCTDLFLSAVQKEMQIYLNSSKL